jgi:hypothetical protein
MARCQFCRAPLKRGFFGTQYAATCSRCGGYNPQVSPKLMRQELQRQRRQIEEPEELTLEEAQAVWRREFEELKQKQYQETHTTALIRCTCQQEITLTYHLQHGGVCPECGQSWIPKTCPHCSTTFFLTRMSTSIQCVSCKKYFSPF